MRKYLSLGAAMMMGSVIAKTDKKDLQPAKYDLQPAQVLGMPTEQQHVETFHFEHAKPIPQPAPQAQRRFNNDDVTSHCTSHDEHSAKVARRQYEERSLTTSNGTVSLGESVDSPDVVPQNVKLTVDIYCGAYVQAVPGYQFYCLDPYTGLYHYCIGRNDWWYQCWDGQEWEWGNFLEADGTGDNSALTSLDTDYMAGTSASILVNDYYSPDLDVEAMAHGAAIEEVSVVTSCDELEVEGSNDWEGQSYEDDFGYYGKSKLVNHDVKRNYYEDQQHDPRKIHGEDDYDVVQVSHHNHY